MPGMEWSMVSIFMELGWVSDEAGFGDVSDDNRCVWRYREGTECEVSGCGLAGWPGGSFGTLMSTAHPARTREAVKKRVSEE